MLRLVLVLFGVSTALFAARDPLLCSDAMLSGGWPSQLRARGFATGRLEDWMGVTGYQLVRSELLAAAANASPRELFFKKDLVGAEDAHGTLTAVFRRIAEAALAPFAVPREFEGKAGRGVTILRTYAAGTGSVARLEGWHQDGGYVQIILALDGPRAQLWQGWASRHYRLAPGEFAVYFGSDLAKPLGVKVPFLRLPRRHQGRADALFRAPWFWGE